jgi:hypothetical protein
MSNYIFPKLSQKFVELMRHASRGGYADNYFLPIENTFTQIIGFTHPGKTYCTAGGLQRDAERVHKPKQLLHNHLLVPVRLHLMRV